MNLNEELDNGEADCTAGQQSIVKISSESARVRMALVLGIRIETSTCRSAGESSSLAAVSGCCCACYEKDLM